MSQMQTVYHVVPKCAIPLIIAAALVVSGCGRKDEPAPPAPPPAPVSQQGAATPPVPDRPAPDVAKQAVPEYPKPGQANDHSSPEFKGGGKETK